MIQHEICTVGHSISLWIRRINTFVYPTGGDTDTHFSDTAKRRNEFGLRRLRCAGKQLSVLDTDIAVTFCVICDRLLFWDVSIYDWH